MEAIDHAPRTDRYPAGLLLLTAYAVGRQAGMDHVIFDSEIWTVETYEPGNTYEGYDQIIYLEIDGQIWEHTMCQG